MRYLPARKALIAAFAAACAITLAACDLSLPGGRSNPGGLKPSGELGVIEFNQTFEDPDTGVLITVQKVTTVWIPIIQPEDIGPDFPGQSMIGIRISADNSQAQYTTYGPFPSSFTIYSTQTGAPARCVTIAERPATDYSGAIVNTAKILQALGGDKAFTTSVSTDEPNEGWLMCRPSQELDAAGFESGGFTVTYHRDAYTTSDGTELPEIMIDAVKVS